MFTYPLHEEMAQAISFSPELERRLADMYQGVELEVESRKMKSVLN